MASVVVDFVPCIMGSAINVWHFDFTFIFKP